MLSKTENSQQFLAVTIGDNIRRLREDARLTRKTLAGLMGMSYQQLYKYEKGQNVISADKIAYLKFCLKADSYDEFFKGLY